MPTPSAPPDASQSPSRVPEQVPPHVTRPIEAVSADGTAHREAINAAGRARKGLDDWRIKHAALSRAERIAMLEGAMAAEYAAKRLKGLR